MLEGITASEGSALSPSPIARVWFAPALVAAAGAVAAGMQAAILGAGWLCPLCRQQAIGAAIGAVLALVAFLSAAAGANAMIVRRLLMVSGLVFAVTAYLVLAPLLQIDGAPALLCGEAGDPVPCGSESLPFVLRHHQTWSVLLSAALTALAFWGVFRPDPWPPTERKTQTP